MRITDDDFISIWFDLNRIFYFFFLIRKFTVEIIFVNLSFFFFLEKYSNIFISRFISFFFLRRIFSNKIFTVHSYTVAIILYFIERIIKSYLHDKYAVINFSYKKNMCFLQS